MVRSAILNTKSGRLLIDTKLSDKALQEFDLTDLRRDVQTDVMNQKSLMTRAVLHQQVLNAQKILIQHQIMLVLMGKLDMRLK